MAWLQNERNDIFYPDCDNCMGSFEEHNQNMRAFRLAHPEPWRQWGQSPPEIQESLPAFVSTFLLKRAVLSTYSPN